MKAFIIICALVFIQGCGNWVSQQDIDKAMELCETNGGVKYLAIFFADNVVCNNGAIFSRGQWMETNQP